MRTTNVGTAPKDKVESYSPELRGSFSKSIDYAELRRRSAAASVVAAAAASTSIRHSLIGSGCSESQRVSLSRMDVRSTTSDSSHGTPSWPHCEATTDQGVLKPEPRGRCYSPCSDSPSPSPSKHFKFCFTDPKSECHRRMKHRRHRHPHQRVHKHMQLRHPDCVRFNASGPVPRQGLISFQYISKLFQPWLWRPSQRAPDSPHYSDDDAEAGMSTIVIIVLVLILIAAAFYLSQNREVWDSLSFEMCSPSKVLGFENYLKNEVIDEMSEKAACADCKPERKVEKVAPAEGDSSSVGLEKYLRKKANRIISRLN